jgi:hypothetical protein
LNEVARGGNGLDAPIALRMVSISEAGYMPALLD